MKHSHSHPVDALHSERVDLLERLSSSYGEKEIRLIALALDWVREAHERGDDSSPEKRYRPNGTEVALLVSQLRVDAFTVIAALLSDPLIRDGDHAQRIERHFGSAIAELVSKVNWLNGFNEYHRTENPEPDQTELLRNLLLAVVKDVRAVLLKLAYRLQRLRLMKDCSDETERRAIAQESLDLFAPLANRLGVGQLKWELEDLAFRYLNPDAYKTLAKSLALNRISRESFVHNFIVDLQGKLEKAAIRAQVFGRPKHIYSIYRKMERKELPLEELYDLNAVRVIVADLATCYAVLSLVHGHWLHIPSEFDDYIAHPKSNGYQSLHTVVIGPGGKPVEIQIRTEEMHNFAEYGVAAHWRYKEGSNQDQALDRSVNTLRQLLESRDTGEEKGLLDSFRTELFEDQIFVLTPKGQVIRLRKGATPVDFAYSIHTEVGHRCRGAKVNGRMKPLNHPLASGDRVEILTVKHGGPSLGWIDPHLRYVSTAHARNKIRAWFRQQDHERLMRVGKVTLDRERHKLGLREVDLDGLARHFHLPRAEDLLLALGRADISAAQLVNAIRPKEWEARPRMAPSKRSRADGVASGERQEEQIVIQGVRNLVTHFARCCHPQPGDPIIGFISRVRGIAIHRQGCANILRLPLSQQGRLIDVSWGSEPDVFPVDVEVRALDRKGLLKDITQILADLDINILKTRNDVDAENQVALMEITMEVSDLAQLSQALTRIGEIHNVLSARRKLDA